MLTYIINSIILLTYAYHTTR